MDIVNVNKLGISRGTAVERAVMANFMGETQEIGIILQW